MKVLCILQARLSSKRFKGKVLKKILGKSIIQLQIERIHQAKLIDKLIIATSTSPKDDKIINEVKNDQVFRGPLKNVLKRYYLVAKKFQPDHILRLTADCPLIDPQIIDQIIEYHLKTNADYTSNTIKPTYPDGLDVEIFKYSSLVKSFTSAKKKSELEHVTLYIKNNPEKFKIKNFAHKNDISHLRWTVDYEEDFVLIKKIYNGLYKRKKIFLMNDILDYISSNPALENINSSYERDSGLKKSLIYDKTLEINDFTKR